MSPHIVLDSSLSDGGGGGALRGIEGCADGGGGGVLCWTGDGGGGGTRRLDNVPRERGGSTGTATLVVVMVISTVLKVLRSASTSESTVVSSPVSMTFRTLCLRPSDDTLRSPTRAPCRLAVDGRCEANETTVGEYVPPMSRLRGYSGGASVVCSGELLLDLRTSAPSPAMSLCPSLCSEDTPRRGSGGALETIPFMTHQYQHCDLSNVHTFTLK